MMMKVAVVKVVATTLAALAVLTYAGIVVAQLTQSSSQANKSAEPVVKLLDGAAASLEWANHSKTVTEFNSRFSYVNDKAGTKIIRGSEGTQTKYQDGDSRIHIKVDTTSIVDGEEIVKEPGRRELVLTKREFTLAVYPRDIPKEGTIQVSRTAAAITKWQSKLQIDPRTLCFLDGHIQTGDKGTDTFGVSVIDLARHSKMNLETASEKVAGVDCRIVDGDTAEGHLRLWIAPSKGNALVKYVLQRQDDASKKTYSDLTIKVQFTATGFLEADGHTVVAGGHYEDQVVSHDPDDLGWTSSIDVKRISVDAKPRFDEPGLFTTGDFPEGTRVVLTDKQELPWKQSSSRPATKPAPVTEAVQESGGRIK